MLKALLHKELMEHVLSLRSSVMLGVALLLFGLMSYLSLQTQERSMEQYRSLERFYKQELAHVVLDGDLRRLFLWDGIAYAVPPPPLGGLVHGTAAHIPEGVRVLPQHWRSTKTIDDPSILRRLYPRPDLAYVVTVVISLLGILLTFDVVVGDKEAGTLRLTLAGAVPRSLVVAMKACAAWLILMAPVLLAMAAMLAYLLTSGAVTVDADNLTRFGMLIGISAVYGSVFVALGVLVSTVSRSAAAALYVALTVWAVWVLVLPNASPMIAEVLAPVPGVREVAEEKAAIDKNIDLRLQWYADDETTEQSQEVAKLEQERVRRKAQWDERRAVASNNRDWWSRSLSRLSPASSCIYAMTEASGTGRLYVAAFNEAADQVANTVGAVDQDLQDRRAAGDRTPPPVDAFPRFRQPFVPTDAAIAGTAIDVSLLLGWCLVLSLAALCAFMRYDVR